MYVDWLRSGDLETAASGRSSCKGCHKTIAKGSKRVSVWGVYTGQIAGKVCYCLPCSIKELREAIEFSNKKLKQIKEEWEKVNK